MTTDDAEDRLRSFCRELIQRIKAHDALEYDEGQSRLPGDDTDSTKLFFQDANGHQWTLGVSGDEGEMKLAGSFSGVLVKTKYDFRDGFDLGYLQPGSGNFAVDTEKDRFRAAASPINNAEDAAERVWRGMRLVVPGLGQKSE